MKAEKPVIDQIAEKLEVVSETEKSLIKDVAENSEV